MFAPVMLNARGFDIRFTSMLIREGLPPIYPCRLCSVESILARDRVPVTGRRGVWICMGRRFGVLEGAFDENFLEFLGGWLGYGPRRRMRAK